MCGEEEEAYRLLVGKPKRKRPLGNPRLRQEDNNKRNRKKNRIGVCGLDSSASRYGQMAASCEHSIGFLDCMNCGKLIK